MNRLKNRIIKIQKKIKGDSEDLVILKGTNETDFEQLIQEHKKRTGCDSDNTLFVCVIDKYI